MWRLTRQYRPEVSVVFASLVFASVFVPLLSAPFTPHALTTSRSLKGGVGDEGH